MNLEWASNVLFQRRESCWFFYLFIIFPLSVGREGDARGELDQIQWVGHFPIFFFSSEGGKGMGVVEMGRGRRGGMG